MSMAQCHAQLPPFRAQRNPILVPEPLPVIDPAVLDLEGAGPGFCPQRLLDGEGKPIDPDHFRDGETGGRIENKVVQPFVPVGQMGRLSH